MRAAQAAGGQVPGARGQTVEGTLTNVNDAPAMDDLETEQRPPGASASGDTGAARPSVASWASSSASSRWLVVIRRCGLANKQTGTIYRSALAVAVANDRIARRYSRLTERHDDALLQRF